MAKAIGIDLGGTSIKAGVVDCCGTVLSRVELPTQAVRGSKVIVANIVTAAGEAQRQAGIAWRAISAIGLGVPGVFELPHGILRHSPNLKCLEGMELTGHVAKMLGRRISVVLENDANVAAYAESWVGAGRGIKTLALFTLGTGIGGGIVLNGRIWRGARGMAAELGHQNLFPNGVRCGCGNKGCLEAYASATALVRRFREAVASGRRSRLTANPGLRRVTARDISLAARAGDRTCLALIEETGRYLGIGVINILHILNVERVVFAGGMTAAGAMLLNPIRKEARRRSLPLVQRGVKILFSRLGNDAGLIGAAGWALAARRQQGPHENPQ